MHPSFVADVSIEYRFHCEQYTGLRCDSYNIILQQYVSIIESELRILSFTRKLLCNKSTHEIIGHEYNRLLKKMMRKIMTKDNPLTSKTTTVDDWDFRWERSMILSGKSISASVFLIHQDTSTLKNDLSGEVGYQSSKSYIISFFEVEEPRRRSSWWGILSFSFMGCLHLFTEMLQPLSFHTCILNYNFCILICNNGLPSMRGTKERGKWKKERRRKETRACLRDRYIESII